MTKMIEEYQSQLKYLRLQGLSANWDEYLALARKSNFSHVRLLKYVIEQEYNLKKENARKARMRRAHIPEQMAIETYPFHKQPKLNKKKILNLYDSFDYMTKHRNIIMIGPTGIGKTGLAISFLIQAINKGNTGRFIMFPDLIDMLFKSAADHSEARVMKKLFSYDCLMIDELGYIEVEPLQVGLFFTLMQKRHRAKTTIITTNLGFSQWESFLKNPQLTAALIDRLTEDSYVINMKSCVSLRPGLIQV
jgi:DNA replication protein DnaC